MKKQKPQTPAQAKLQALGAKIQAQFAEITERVMTNPNAAGWLRLCELLEKAAKDKRIVTSPGAREFVELAHELASDAFTASSAEQAIEPLAKVLQTDKQSKNARARNAKHKAWVQAEWAKHGHAPGGYGGNKSAFSRDYAGRLANEHSVKVTAREIRDRWLRDI